MPLTQQQLRNSVDILFDPTVDTLNDQRVMISANAFQNLVIHYINTQGSPYRGLVQFDNNKLVIMLKRFYRDAWGVCRFAQKLDSWDESKVISKNLKVEIQTEVQELSIRINSDEPEPPRVAAAFSLWMATFRPIFLTKVPSTEKERAWRLDATINFWIATTYLQLYGDIRFGDNGDLRGRLRQIWYDFTYRAINLSALEFMYAFIFVPDKTLNARNK